MRKILWKAFALLVGLVVAHSVAAKTEASGGCSVGGGTPTCQSSGSVLGSKKNLFDSYLFGKNCHKQSLWSWGGWVESGLYVNNHGQTNAYDADGFIPESGNTQLLNNVRQSDFQMNQAWLYLEKKLCPRGSFDIGGRIDFMYGTDGWFLQSDGFERENGHDPWGDGDYFAALPQAYLEAGNKTLNVRAGKFLSLLGYESAMAPNRFFYSLSYSYMTVPATMTGAVVNWNPTNKLALYGGWISSHDSTFDSGYDSAFVGGFKYQLNRRVNFGYGFMKGQERYGIDPMYLEDDNFIHSLVLNIKPGCRWDYTLCWNLQNQSADFDNWGRYCIAQELIYRINNCWAVGVRGEWVRFYDSALYDHMGGYEFTLGANWTPNSWLLIRPEIRYDEITEGNIPVFNLTKSGYTDGKYSQLSGGLSCVVKF